MLIYLPGTAQPRMNAHPVDRARQPFDRACCQLPTRFRAYCRLLVLVTTTLTSPDQKAGKRVIPPSGAPLLRKWEDSFRVRRDPGIVGQGDKGDHISG